GIDKEGKAGGLAMGVEVRLLTKAMEKNQAVIRHRRAGDRQVKIGSDGTILATGWGKDSQFQDPGKAIYRWSLGLAWKACGDMNQISKLPKRAHFLPDPRLQRAVQ